MLTDINSIDGVTSIINLAQKPGAFYVNRRTTRTAKVYRT